MGGARRAEGELRGGLRCGPSQCDFGLLYHLMKRKLQFCVPGAHACQLCDLRQEVRRLWSSGQRETWGGK